MLKKFNLKKIIIITSFVVIYNLKIYSQIYNPQQLIPSQHWIYDAIYYLQLESKQISLLDNSPISVAELNLFLKSIDFYKYYIENPPKNVLCTKDDILMTRTGNTGIVVTDIDGCFHNNFFKINIMKSIYFFGTI